MRQSEASTESSVSNEVIGFGCAVNFHLGRVKGTDEVLEDLHVVLFRRKGKNSTRKRDIKKFSGFVYAEGSEVRKLTTVHVWSTLTVHGSICGFVKGGPLLQELEKNKDLQKIANLKLERIHQIMDILDVPRGLGDKVWHPV